MTFQTVPRTKKCPGCRQVKPVTEFRTTRWGKPEARCAVCRDRAYARNPTRNRVVTRRARQRTTADLLRLHADEFTALMEQHRAAVEAELDATGGHQTRLRPGQRKPGETAADRIARECKHCGSFHDSDHHCPVCGTTPDAPATEVTVQPGKPFRLPRDGTRVVLHLDRTDS